MGMKKQNKRNPKKKKNIFRTLFITSAIRFPDSWEAIHGSKTRKNSQINICSCYLEWAMKHFSTTEFHPPRQLPQAEERESVEPEKYQEERKEVQETEEDEKEEEERARCEWDFSLRTVVSPSGSAASASSDALGVIEFDQSDSIIATGGIARRIRIYRLRTLLPSLDELSSRRGQYDTVLFDHAGACEYYICTPAKLSSLRWKSGSDGRVLGSGDYDGVVMEYDLEKRLPVFERDEHGGRRVWSVDYSPCYPSLGASGSDDGTVQMWDPRCEGGETVAAVQPSAAPSAVCCVEFNPFGGSMVAVGCADRRAYGYDIRMMVDPLVVLDGHGKTVTYVKFPDSHTLVSASIDGCLKLWNLDESRAIRTYRGHVNNRNFVGLSIWRNGGLLGCGSENNQVFVYDKRWGEPIWVQRFEPVASGGCSHRLVSSVCWRQVGEDQCTLVAGGSDGALQVYEGRRKPFVS